MFSSSPLFLTGVCAVVLGTFGFSSQLFRKLVPQQLKSIESVIGLSVLLVGAGWSVTLSSFFLRFGIIGQQALLTTVIVCGVNAGAFILLNPSRKFFYFYFLPMVFVPSGFGLTVVHDLQDITLMMLMGIYNLFLIFSAPPIRKRYQEGLEYEYQLKKEKDKVESVINAFPGIVSIIDSNEVYQLMNRFGTEALGRGDVIGKPLGFMDPSDGLVKEVRQYMKSGPPGSVTKELQIKTAHGSHWFLVSMSRLGQPEGWIIIVSVVIDELVQARQSAEEQREKANYAARLASLGEMAQGVAHEINNPLAVVMFSAEEIQYRIQKNEIDNDFLSSFTDKILLMSQRISKIVKALRYFSRDAENDPIRSVNLSFIINQTLEFRAEKYKKNGVDFIVSDYPADLKVECREVQILQAMINLLNNAYDAAIETKPSWIKLDIDADEMSVRVRIIDSGPGISEALRERIFEPFYTTKDVNQGHGLGLSISLGLLQSNGGTLRYIAGDNTCFEMEMVRGS